MSVVVSDTTGVARLGVTLGLTFVLGFERQLRGSPAGSWTFSLIGLGAAVIGLLSAASAPNALAGAVTGIGFIGAGLVFRQQAGRSETVRGVTTAAAIFVTAAIGAAAGEGRLLIATAATGLVLLSLELPYVPGLRVLDAAATSTDSPPTTHHRRQTRAPTRSGDRPSAVLTVAVRGGRDAIAGVILHTAQDSEYSEYTAGTFPAACERSRRTEAAVGNAGRREAQAAAAGSSLRAFAAGRPPRKLTGRSPCCRRASIQIGQPMTGTAAIASRV